VLTASDKSSRQVVLTAALNGAFEEAYAVFGAGELLAEFYRAASSHVHDESRGAREQGPYCTTNTLPAR